MAAEQRSRHARRITTALFVSQSLGSAGSIAAATVAAIVGAELSGSKAMSGLPAAMVQIGVAVGALYWSRLSDRTGRRTALTGALLTGALGAALSLVGVVSGNFILVLVALLITGSGNAAVQLGRFVAAEVNPQARRARALSTVVLGGTFGSVAGPLLVGPTGRLVESWGWNEIAGPYLATGAGYLLTALLLFLSLRPEPMALGREIAAEEEGPGASGTPRTLRQLWQDPRVRLAVTGVVTAHMVMVGLMQMTSLHMHELGHTLTNISMVFAGHTFGMYAFSMGIGWLTDRYGRELMLGIGAAILLASCLLAPVWPGLWPLGVALFLLGIGWNFCFVAGSALLADVLNPLEKGRMQGVNDLLVGAAAAAATLGGGMFMAAGGYTLMSLIGAGLVLPLAVVVLSLRRRQPVGGATG